MGNFTSSLYSKVGSYLRNEHYCNSESGFATILEKLEQNFMKLEKLEQDISHLQQYIKCSEKDTGERKDVLHGDKPLRKQEMAQVLSDDAEVEAENRCPDDTGMHDLLPDIVQENVSYTILDEKDEDPCGLPDVARYLEDDPSACDRETIQEEQSSSKVADPKTVFLTIPTQRAMGSKIEDQNGNVGGHRRTSPDGMEEEIKPTRPHTQGSHNLQETEGGQRMLDILPEAREAEVESETSNLVKRQGIGNIFELDGTTNVDDRETVDRRNSSSRPVPIGEETPKLKANSEPKLSPEAHKWKRPEDQNQGADKQNRTKGHSRQPADGIEMVKEVENQGKDTGDEFFLGLRKQGCGHDREQGNQREPPDGLVREELCLEVAQPEHEAYVVKKTGHLEFGKIQPDWVKVFRESTTSDAWPTLLTIQNCVFVVPFCIGKLDQEDDLRVEKQIIHSLGEITRVDNGQKIDIEHNLLTPSPCSGELQGLNSKAVLRASVNQEKESNHNSKTEKVSLPKKHVDVMTSGELKRNTQEKTRPQVSMGEQRVSQTSIDVIHDEIETPHHGETHEKRSVSRQDNHFPGTPVLGERGRPDLPDADEQMIKGQDGISDVERWETDDAGQRGKTMVSDRSFKHKTDDKAMSVEENYKPVVGKFDDGGLARAVNKHGAPKKPLGQIPVDSFKQNHEKFQNMQGITVVDERDGQRLTKDQSDAVQVTRESETPGCGSVDKLPSNAAQQNASTATPVGCEQENGVVCCFGEQTNHDPLVRRRRQGEKGPPTISICREQLRGVCWKNNCHSKSHPYSKMQSFLWKTWKTAKWRWMSNRKQMKERTGEHKRVLLKLYTWLKDNVDVDGNLVPYLFQRGILELAQKEAIDAERMSSKKIQILLDELLKKRKHAFDVFCRGLEENGQPFISAALSNSGIPTDNYGMTSGHKAVLRSEYMYLIEYVGMESLVPCLYQEEILQRHDVEKINIEQRHSKKVEAFLDILPKKGAAAFDAFCRALERDGQGFIVKKLSQALNFKNYNDG